MIHYSMHWSPTYSFAASSGRVLVLALVATIGSQEGHPKRSGDACSHSSAQIATKHRCYRSKKFVQELADTLSVVPDIDTQPGLETWRVP